MARPASSETISRSSASGRPFRISFCRFCAYALDHQPWQQVPDDRRQDGEQDAARVPKTRKIAAEHDDRQRPTSARMYSAMCFGL